MAQTGKLITADALAAVGVHRPLRHGQITAGDIRRFCVAVDNRDPLHLDPAAARAAGHADVIAPPLYPHAPARPAPFQSELLPDGQLPDLAPPGLTHLQSLLAGQDWEFIRPAVAGERIVEDSWYGSIEEREGRNGPLVFVMEHSEITSEAGDPILRSRNQLIFRQPPPPQPSLEGAAEAPAAAPGPVTSFVDGKLIKRPSLVGLFMFDATIWATHRLHWDAGQARREGLPGPVLPGWMAASYVSEFAQSQAPAGMRLASLSLRYKSFAFPGDELTCTRVGGTTTECSISLTNQSGEEVQSGVARYA